MPEDQMGNWYARPVLFVADVEISVRFYVEQLGFAEAWHHLEDDKLLVAEVGRSGCTLILSSQWPDKVGAGLIFVSLDPSDFDALLGEFALRGLDVREGWWGYRLVIVTDPDGNELYFPWPEKDGDAA